MSNKSILQSNNETLDSIFSNVLGLPSQESLKHGAYVWKKLTAEGGDFVDFAVSDSPTAYPDGGEQGGYWYEKVVEEITPEMFGCTKMAVDTFTFASATYCTTELSHSLGEKPKVLLIMTAGELSLNNELKYSFSCLTGTYVEVNTSDAFYSTSNRAITLANSTITLTSTTFKKQNRNYSAGKEYIVITMA